MRYITSKFILSSPLTIFCRLLFLLLLLQTAAQAEVKKHYSMQQVSNELTVWQRQVENSKTLSSTERQKELEFISRLGDRLTQDSSSILTIDQFKSSLTFLDKNSRRGSNSLYSSDEFFLKQSLQIVNELEPDEDPILVLKNYMLFASIEKSSQKTRSAEAFESTRTYINKDSSLPSDPDDLDEAAQVVEQKIFHLQSEESL